ncbi:MAG: 2-oxo acid dehydrogenase subunit E2 [Ignavibacteriae bacterium]|nr:2-oxo acid dehydrogenase subunit E2 [Ignavibacteriota bacterium]
MNHSYEFQNIPKSRIATFDVYQMGLQKHHVAALLEFDVTESRSELRELKRSGKKISFNAFLIKAISKAVELHPEAAGYIYSKKKLMLFKDVNISFIVEKTIGGKKVPMPVVIEKSNEKTAEDITREIEDAKNYELTEKDIILNKKSQANEKIYYRLPKFLRIMFWRYMLSHPKFAYEKMGNVIVTSLGAAGKINGWFVHKSVHPLSFGIGSVLKKPVVIKDEIKIREILNMTILIDHDPIDGAPMVRFIGDLTDYIENFSRD